MPVSMDESKTTHGVAKTPLGTIIPVDDDSVKDFSQDLVEHGLTVCKDGFVRWNQGSPAHPRNWKQWRKVYDTAVILFLEFLT